MVWEIFFFFDGKMLESLGYSFSKTVGKKLLQVL